MNKAPKPLYRKINTCTHGVHDHSTTGKFKWDRHTKETEERSESGRLPMRNTKRGRGYDYSPLYRFLLSKIGQPWAEVRKAAEERLDDKNEIWSMVWSPDEDPHLRWTNPSDGEPPKYFRSSDTAFISMLTVRDGVLVKVDPDFQPNTIRHWCNCCTYTFNGSRLPKQVFESSILE